MRAARGRLGAGRGKVQQGRHPNGPPDRRGHLQRRPVLFLCHFGRQGTTVPHNACSGQPREHGRRGERHTHIGTAYSRIIVYIHKTGTRVFLYNINILDEISGIVQISLMCAWSRRVDRPIRTRQTHNDVEYRSYATSQPRYPYLTILVKRSIDHLHGCVAPFEGDCH